MYTAGSSITGNGGGTSNLPGDLLIFTSGVWSLASSSAHMACPCRSTLGIKSLITNGLLEQYNPDRLHCCRMYANISPVSKSTRKNCVPKYGSNHCNVITTAPAWPPTADWSFEIFLSFISSRVRFVPSGTIHPNGNTGRPVRFLSPSERLKFAWMFNVRSTSS